MSCSNDNILGMLTIEEKASLCSGADYWNTKAVADKGIPSFMVSDGPHGLRRQIAGQDNLGINKSEPATCFPSAAGMACSWNTELMHEVGQALGDECLAQGVGVLLGPGVNIKRSPLCGRNFEYFSEDPHLTARLAESHIKGVQSRGIGCAVKHFAVNNQESGRMYIDAQVDERALREIYLSAFEYIIKNAKPWMVMGAYNKLNSAFCCENKRLLTDILRGEWGFDGVVVSDWGAVNDRVAGLKSGMDLEMPYTGSLNDSKIVEAAKNGSLNELDETAHRIIALAQKAQAGMRENYLVDMERHHVLARRAALESMVLLKNANYALPLRNVSQLAIIGEFAEKPKVQGAGSSRVNPWRVENLFEELASESSALGITYSRGYSLEVNEIDEKIVDDALETAKNCDSVVVFAGVPDRVESEGFDRPHMRLPDNQNYLIDRLAELNKRIVVVLLSGAPVELPWIDQVDCVLAAYMGGQAMPGALAKLLFGAVSPCGKLAETWPVCLEHNPSYFNFPGDGEKVEYKEGVFVGYRYYDAKKIKPMFPFGHGLSYSEFSYENITTDKQTLNDGEDLKISADIRNTGAVAAKETVQLYVKNAGSMAPRPIKELRAFAKVELSPKECKTVSFTLDRRAFAYYCDELCDWRVEAGEYSILIGASSEDIRLSAAVRVDAPNRKMVFTPWSPIGEIAKHPAGAKIIESMFRQNMPDDNVSEALGMSAYDLIKDMPLIKIIAMGGQCDAEATAASILVALNET